MKSKNKANMIAIQHQKNTIKKITNGLIYTSPFQLISLIKLIIRYRWMINNNYQKIISHGNNEIL